MTEIVSIRFNERGKSYFFDPSGLTVEKGEYVVVETAKGFEYGECVRGNHQVDDDSVIQPLRPVVRIATDADNRSAQAGKEKEKEAFDYCRQKIIDLGLEMKLVSDFITALTGDSVKLMECMFRIDKLDRFALSRFLEITREHVLSAIKESIKNNDTHNRRAFIKTEETFNKAEEMLALNVSSGNISGYICAGVLDTESSKV